MEKIVITEEEKVTLDGYVLSQEKMKLNVIDRFIENKKRDNRPFVSLYKPLNRFTPEQFALLLCGWYEVEQPIKVGDWVQSEITNKFYKTVDTVTYDDKCISIQDAVLTSLSDKFKKIEEPWKIMLLELGRDKPEFKVGDKYTMNDGSQVTVYHVDDEEGDTFHSDTFKYGQVKYFYPVESRIEVNGYDSNRE